MQATAATRETPELLTVGEAAERLRVSRPTMYRLIRAGVVPALRIGDGVGPIRIPVAELDSWLDGRRIQPEETETA